ncbi:helix-turn-helix domain-containing protein [Steroidobacter sp.]|uniref:helix-turn-helix transcriptional regulator n=1 Tax=Steroidobacter sp. TaxID=1978227 RepID=UPI002ED98FD8
MPTKQESRAYFDALGAHIGLLRKEYGMTQAEPARAIGVSQQAVFAYETGERRVSIPIMLRLSKVFSVTLEQLTGMESPVRGKRRLSPRAARHGERIQALSKTRQRFLVRIIDLLEAEMRPALTSEEGKRAERVSAVRSTTLQRPKQNETSHERH